MEPYCKVLPNLFLHIIIFLIKKRKLFNKYNNNKTALINIISFIWMQNININSSLRFVTNADFCKVL